MTPKECPNCNESLQGEPIPEEYRDKHYGGKTHYSNVIGIYDVYNDKTVAWRCPYCNHEWEVN